MACCSLSLGVLISNKVHRGPCFLELGNSHETFHLNSLAQSKMLAKLAVGNLSISDSKMLALPVAVMAEVR